MSTGWTKASIREVAGVNPPNPTCVPADDDLVSFVPMAAVEAMSGRMDPTDARPWKDVKKGYTRFQERDVLVAKITPSMENGKAAVARGLVGGVGAGTTEFHVLRPTAAVLPEWLFYQVVQDDFRKAARSRMTGTAGQLRVPSRFYEQRETPVAPLPEQRRIVDAIESYFTRLEAAVATLERVQRNVKRYRASVLQAAVEGRLVPTEAELASAEGRDYEHASVLLERILAERRRRWEEAELAKMQAKGKVPKDDKWKAKYKEPVAPDMSDLPELPEGWCWAALPQLGELDRGRSRHRPRNDTRLLGGPYPFIQTGDVRHSDGFIREYTATYSEFGLAQSRLWPAGTLCITIAANIADTGILTFEACFPDSVVGFRNDTQAILVRFIELFIRTAKRRLDRYAPATAQKNINLAVLAGVVVPIPPVAEQNRIVAEIDRLLSVAASVDTSVTYNALRCSRLRQSILKWAFEGKLVNQDPTDEPASVLLERIKAERASSNGRQPTKRTRRKPTKTKA